MSQNLFPIPAAFKVDADEHRRDIARAVAGLMIGRRNGMGLVTLTASSTTTVISDSRITPDTIAILEPLSATAAGAVGGLYQTATAGSITLTHASTAATDKNFAFVLVG